MAKLHKPGDRVRVEIPGTEDQPKSKRPVYWLTVPTVYDKIEHDRRVEERGGSPVGPRQLRAAARAAVERFLPDGDPKRLELLGLLDKRDAADEAARAGESDENEDPTEAETATLQELDRELRRHDPDYRRLAADQTAWVKIQLFEAARMFLADWQNAVDRRGRALAFARDFEGVPADLLDRLPPSHVNIVGGRALDLFGPDADEAKNSDSPSHGTGAGTNSTLPATANPTRRNDRGAEADGNIPK